MRLLSDRNGQQRTRRREGFCPSGKELIMRVISGTARHLPLKTPKGLETRPTTDRIKETLFNMLQNEIYGCRFLDLFSGSGGIGIEALSRGASKAVFVDSQREAVSCIRENLAFTHLEDRAEVMPEDCLTAIARLAQRKEAFDLIFMDPPYKKELEKEVLTFLSHSSLVKPSAKIIVEAALETDFSYAGEFGFTILKEKCYKTNKHVFLQKEK